MSKLEPITALVSSEHLRKIQRIWKLRNNKAESPSDAPSVSGIIRDALDIGLDKILIDLGEE